MSHFGEPRLLRDARARLLGDLTGLVLEVGAGNGANLPYYGKEARIAVTEPDPFLLGRARKRVKGLTARAFLCRAVAEELPFPDGCFDFVVCTLVLCSVVDVTRALQEIKRVLKPNGVFRFLEHIRSERPRVALLQDRLTPLWRRVGGNCHMNRPTLWLMEQAGFKVDSAHVGQLSPLLPIVMGTATPRA